MPYISNSHPNPHPTGHWGDISTAGHSLPAEFSKPPSTKKSDFCSWMRDFFNCLTGIFGEKLSCSKLNSALNDIFNPTNGWQAKAHFEFGGTNQVGYRSKQKDGITYIVSSACHDLTNPNPMQDLLSGGRTAAQTLNEIKKAYPHEQVKVLVPIAQSNKFCGSTRGHFVLLEVDMHAGKIQSAKIHDSKGPLLDTFYNGARHLTKQLLAEKELGLDKDFAVTSEHLGHQALLNGKDCGRFTAYYADKIIDDNLSNANAKDARAFFARYQKLA